MTTAHDLYYDEDRHRNGRDGLGDLSQCCDCGNWTDIEPCYTIDETPDGVLCPECDMTDHDEVPAYRAV
jgi:hypothetical protein